MYYLRQYETIIFSNGQYVHIPVSLSKADCYGIMKRNHVYKTPTYDDNYITQYNNTRTIKHPTQDLWCVEFETTEGINPLYLNYLESKETLELDGWIIDTESVGIEFVPIEAVQSLPTMEDRVTALEDVMMMLLI